MQTLVSAQSSFVVQHPGAVVTTHLFCSQFATSHSPVTTQSSGVLQHDASGVKTHFEATQASEVHASPSPHAASVEQQPVMADTVQMPPAEHVSVLQRSSSAQSASLMQQPAMGGFWQAPERHTSAVHAFPSLQSADAVQHPGTIEVSHCLLGVQVAFRQAEDGQSAFEVQQPVGGVPTVQVLFVQSTGAQMVPPWQSAEVAQQPADAAAGTFLQAPPGPQLSVVHGSLSLQSAAALQQPRTGAVWQRPS